MESWGTPYFFVLGASYVMKGDYVSAEKIFKEKIADPGFKEVDNARARLAALKSSS